MGQATVDLPDPMQSPAAPATAGTDDLLAQLAGDEIERLLAETETERPASPAAAASPLPDVAVAKSVPGESPAPGLPPSFATAPAASASAAIEPSATKENLTTQLDALFESLNGAATPPAPVAVAPVAPPPAEPLNKKTGVTDPGSESAVPPDDVASSAAELKALGAPIATPESVPNAAKPTAPVAALSENETSTRPSLLVRLLEIINSPLGQCSDPVRQTVGKIAIATLLNAIAILAYTLVVRHR